MNVLRQKKRKNRFIKTKISKIHMSTNLEDAEQIDDKNSNYALEQSEKISKAVLRSSINTSNKLHNSIKKTKKHIKYFYRKKNDNFFLKNGNKLHFSKTSMFGKKNNKLFLKKKIVFNILPSSALAFGAFCLILIIVFSLLGLITTSFLGIFLSSEHNEKNYTIMSDFVNELNYSMDNKIQEIQNNIMHDEVIINANKANWIEILSIYTIRVSNGDNIQEVMFLNNEKKKVLTEIFLDMNIINYEVKNMEYENDSIGELKSPNYDINQVIKPDENKNVDVLLIKIDNVHSEEIKKRYNFTETQNKQYDELINEKNRQLWYNVLYGTKTSNNVYATWKQYDEAWKNIKVGTSNSTVGEIGCLVTSVSILIEKSNSAEDFFNFNPGIFVQILNDNYGFDQNGNLRYSVINKVVHDFEYIGQIDLTNNKKIEKINKIREISNLGYEISIEVLGGQGTNQHWVALDKIVDNQIFIYDPASEANILNEKYLINNVSKIAIFKSANH